MIKIEAYQCEYCTKHRKGTGKPIRISRRKDTIYSHTKVEYPILLDLDAVSKVFNVCDKVPKHIKDYLKDE